MCLFLSPLAAVAPQGSSNQTFFLCNINQQVDYPPYPLLKESLLVQKNVLHAVLISWTLCQNTPYSHSQKCCKQLCKHLLPVLNSKFSSQGCVESLSQHMPHINTNNTQAGEECSLNFVFFKL